MTPQEDVDAGKRDTAQGAQDDAPTPQVEDADVDREPRGAAIDDDARVHVSSTFNGTVIVGEGGAIGYAVGDRVQRDSGLIVESLVTATRRYYLKPEGFSEKAAALRGGHLLLLVGREGTGRAAGALMLADLCRETGTPIYRLPPTRSLAELSRQRFKSGRCYLVYDWLRPSSGPSSVERFDADQLAARLRAAGAYLVLTTTQTSRPGAGSSAYEKAWTAPDLGLLFDHCFERMAVTAEAQSVRGNLRERAARAGSARQVVRLVEGLVDGVHEALSAVEDNDREAITAWFDAEPGRRAVRAATVLAFAGRAGDDGDRDVGVGQRNFELLYARLEEAQAAFRGDRPPEESPAPPDDEPQPQDRHTLFANSGLTDFIVPPTRNPGVGAQHHPGFRTRRQRDLVMELLYQRYGNDVWGPVNLWLHEVADQSVVTDAQISVAYGLGRFALHAFDEVRSQYLEHWAAGGWTQRTCAVYALWSMAESDDLAPPALSLATGWVHNRGPERAITAAIALGGALGKRYPSEAMRRLWPLALRGRAISGYARLAIGNLLAIESADETDSGGVARYLANKIRPLLKPQAATDERRAALWAVVGVLDLNGRSAEVPLAAQVLRERPGIAQSLGELWAGSLRSAPHRSDAVAALHRTLLALVEVQGGDRLAARLGEAVLPLLSSAQQRQVELGLRAAQTPKEQREARLAVLRAFLGSAPGTRNTNAGHRFDSSGKASLLR